MKQLNRVATNFLFVLFAGALSFSAVAVDKNEKLKSYVLAYKGPGDLKQKLEETKAKLEQGGFQLLGDYSPYDKSHVIAITSDKLKEVAGKSENGGFAAVERVAVVERKGEVQISYVNPIYMSQAYKLEEDLADVRASMEKALGSQVDFGTKGVKAKDLRKYHYTFGMEYFSDVYQLAEFASYQEATATLEKSLETNTVEARKVYRLDLPGDVSIFGVSMKAGPKGNKAMDDAWIMSEVDFQDLSIASYLPTEIMVTGGKVVALHMRFRMAVHNPDMKMMGPHSFMQLMKSPDAINDGLKQAVTGK